MLWHFPIFINLEVFRFMEWNQEIFPVHGMESGIFPGYGMKPGNFSDLRNKKQDFFRNVPEFRKTEKIPGYVT